MSHSASSTATPSHRGQPSRLWILTFAAMLLALGYRGRSTEAERAREADASYPRGRGPSARTQGRRSDRQDTSGAGDAGRGREASGPTQIPARGWKDILWRVYEEMGNDRLLAVAAGVTFYGLLAIFPAIAALISLYGLFADPQEVQSHLQSLSSILPGGAVQIIGDQITRISEKGGGGLGLGFIIGLALSLWTANAGVKAIFDALNIVYDEEEKRGFFKLNLQSLLFTLGTIVFLILALVAIAVVPIVLKFIGLGSALEWIIRIARWPLLLAVVIFGLAVLYRFGPSRDRAEWRWITPGSLFAAVGWLIFSMLFSWYVANFGSYNETYGSLGAAIGFMTWIWLSTTIILLGAEINAETEHQTKKDSTEGPSKPMGQRGATMADTVGAAKT
ncbi:YihY/virulence factor BrkB family protein [Microvirga massiliensis]|uniref:YihY/virulence factor BrkB family protein n=1 Tax=Microvirga massiliensis TaxID=1033741 RepID=UPI00093FDE94|nr:YihY/virulence factor BrkB family protein [Microvirga massiliensis]